MRLGVICSSGGSWPILSRVRLCIVVLLLDGVAGAVVDVEHVVVLSCGEWRLGDVDFFGAEFNGDAGVFAGVHFAPSAVDCVNE